MKYLKSIHGLILCAALALFASAVWPSAAQPSDPPNDAPTAEVVSADAPAPGGLGALGGILALIALGTVATAAIDTPERPGLTSAHPVAAGVIIYAGTLVALDTSGNANPAANTSGLKVIGRAEETVDNSDGSAGDLNVNIKRGIFKYANSGSAAVDANDVGKVCYVEDDTTVTETASNSIKAGIVIALDDAGASVWVDTRLHLLTVAAIDAGGVGTTELAANAVTTAKITDANVTPAKTNIVEARTATADGLTTAIIGDTTTHVTVTSGNADHIIVLPTPTPGRQVVINVGANGFELRSSTPASVAINGGTGASAESAIAANSTVLAICVSATAWKAIFLDADSDVAKVEAAA